MWGLHPVAVLVLLAGIAALVFLLIISLTSGSSSKTVLRRGSNKSTGTAESHDHASSTALLGFVKSAAEEGNVKILRRWLEGVSINIDGKDSRTGMTAIHYAAKGGHGDAIRMIAEAGADLNLQDNDGNTPLHLACQNGHGLCVKLLLDKNANPFINNTKDETCLQLAERNGHVGCARLVQLETKKRNPAGQDGDLTLRSLRRGSRSTDNV